MTWDTERVKRKLKDESNVVKRSSKESANLQQYKPFRKLANLATELKDQSFEGTKKRQHQVSQWHQNAFAILPSAHVPKIFQYDKNSNVIYPAIPILSAVQNAWYYRMNTADGNWTDILEEAFSVVEDSASFAIKQMCESTKAPTIEERWIISLYIACQTRRTKTARQEAIDYHRGLAKIAAGYMPGDTAERDSFLRSKGITFSAEDIDDWINNALNPPDEPTEYENRSANETNLEIIQNTPGHMYYFDWTLEKNSNNVPFVLGDHPSIISADDNSTQTELNMLLRKSCEVNTPLTPEFSLRMIPSGRTAFKVVSVDESHVKYRNLRQLAHASKVVLSGSEEVLRELIADAQARPHLLNVKEPSFKVLAKSEKHVQDRMRS